MFPGWQRYHYLIIGMMILLLSACGKDSEIIWTESESALSLMASEQTETIGQMDVIYVFVCGEVRQPGVYALPQESRVFQAIEAAGGETAEACLDLINPAAIVADGEKVYVPGYDESQMFQIETEKDDGRININTADLALLMTLPGVGEKKAQAIIDYRQEHGPFDSIEEIMQVPGIKNGVYVQIKSLIKTD